MPAIAGGPLVIVPTAQGLEPARWEGTVPVYVDLGGLGVVDPAQATGLLRAALKSWSAVRTSTFRAQIVGTTGDLGLGDITGANAGSVIGAIELFAILYVFCHAFALIYNSLAGKLKRR